MKVSVELNELDGTSYVETYEGFSPQVDPSTGVLVLLPSGPGAFGRFYSFVPGQWNALVEVKA